MTIVVFETGLDNRKLINKWISLLQQICIVPEMDVKRIMYDTIFVLIIVL